MLHFLLLYLPIIKAVAETIGSLLTGGGLLYTAVRGVPIIRDIWRDRKALASENALLLFRVDSAEARARVADENAKTAQQSADAWQSRFESLEGIIDEFKADVNSKIARMEHKQAISTRYICELFVWGRDFKRRSDPMPAVPDELKDDIDATLRAGAITAPQPMEYR